MPITVRSSGIAPQGPQNVGGPRASAAQFGGREARALMNQGESIGRQGQAVYNAWQKAETEHDNARVLEATMKYDDDLQEHYFTYVQENQGAKGLNAKQDFDDYSKTLWDESLKYLENDRQREQWIKQAFASRQRFVGSGMDFELKQHHAYNNDQVGALMHKTARKFEDPNTTEDERNILEAEYFAAKHSTLPYSESSDLADMEQFKVASKKGIEQAWVIKMDTGPVRTSDLLGEMDKNPWGKMRHVPKDWQEKFTPEEYVVFRNQQIARRDGIIKGQKEQGYDALYMQFWKDAKVMSPEAAQIKFGLFVDKMDPDTRKAMDMRFDRDKGIMKDSYDAANFLTEQNFKQRAKQEGWSHSEALAMVNASTTLGKESKEFLVRYYTGERNIPTVKNMEKATDGLALVDEGALKTNDDIEKYARDNDLTDTQTESLYKERDRGGNKADITYNSASAVYKRVIGGKMSHKYYDMMVKNFPPGVRVDESGLAKHMSALAMEGEAKPVPANEMTGIFNTSVKGNSGETLYTAKYFGYGQDMTYAEALEHGQADAWLPSVTKAEARAIKQRLLERGITNPSDEDIRLQKKMDMGIKVKVDAYGAAI